MSLSTLSESKDPWIDIQGMTQPSAFIPVALSLAALLLVLGNSILFGMRHAQGGNTADQIFQVLMGAQLPVVIFLILRRLRRYPRETLGIVAVQSLAALLAYSVEFVLNWAAGS
jgi:hypothetical protein